MRAQELRFEDLFETDPQGGVLRFAGERVLLLDAVALGLLRAQLVKTFGVNAARALLTQLGYAHGRRSAEAIRHTLAWENEREWRIAGGRLHRLQGLVRFEPAPRQPGVQRPFADALWLDSYEAEQHLMHLGRAPTPVCWSLCGFASGYLSAATSEEIYCVEQTCVGQGDAVCRMIGRSRADWGEAIDEHLPFYERDCIDAALATLQGDLEELEAKVQARRRTLAASGLRPVLQEGMIVRSRQMEQVVERASKAAGVDTTVLILGGTGVGKERLARLVGQAVAHAQPIEQFPGPGSNRRKGTAGQHGR